MNHGMSKTKLYSRWTSMMARCYRPLSNGYSRYGGSGITVSDRWQSFLNFVEDMGDGFKDEFSLDRIDNNLGYFKSNCRWVTNTEQQRNKKNTKYIEYKGNRYTVNELAEILGINKYTLRNRVFRKKNPVGSIAKVLLRKYGTGKTKLYVWS